MVNIPTDLWIPAVTKPEKTLAKANKGKASLVDAAAVMALAGLVSGAVGGLLSGPIGFVAGAIGGAIGLLIGSLLMNGAVWVMAKVLGGKGEFSKQYYLYSLFGAPITIASAVIGLIPMAGGIISALLSIYMLWPLTISIKQVHKLDTVKAVLAWLIPAIILAIIAFIIGAAIAAMMVMYGISRGTGSFG
jgi:hypothetical protein